MRNKREKNNSMQMIARHHRFLDDVQGGAKIPYTHGCDAMVCDAMCAVQSNTIDTQHNLLDCILLILCRI